MEKLLSFGLHVLCYALIMLSILIFYTTLCRYIREDKTPRKWFLLSLFFVPIFCASIWYTQSQHGSSAPPVDWNTLGTYVGLAGSILLCAFAFWILAHMYDFTLAALVCGVDPLEKKYWQRKHSAKTDEQNAPEQDQPV